MLLDQLALPNIICCVVRCIIEVTCCNCPLANDWKQGRDRNSGGNQKRRLNAGERGTIEKFAEEGHAYIKKHKLTAAAQLRSRLRLVFSIVYLHASLILVSQDVHAYAQIRLAT